MRASAEALQEEFRRDSKLVYMATDIQADLRKEFGEERVRQTPISESAFMGAAIGLAGAGFRAIADMRMATFAFVAMDQIVNQAAKITYMFGGQARFSILVRMSVGAGLGFAAQHEISPWGMYMNVPGLKIIAASTPYDIKGLLKSAIRDDNPVISFENSLLGGMMGDVPEGDYTVPLGVADVKREGKDVTVIAISRMVHEALAAAAEVEKQGISVEVIDPRTLVPMDKEALKKSVKKTGRLVAVDEACQTCGAAAEIVSLIVEDKGVFGKLKAAPRRVCGLDVPIPYSPPMWKYAIPDKDKIVKAIREVITK
jgi:pyruvate dehydrogenase E1 component beta subunit